VDTELGQQLVYTTEGVRWQIKRHLDHSGRWTFEEFVALAKMIFTGEDVPKSVVILCGKNFLENIQCIDFSKHPEVQISVKTNDLGWKVTAIHTVFGEFEFKRDPTLDYLGWSNSAAAIAYDRLVHYVYKAEHGDSERIEGHEATREHTIVWDALALKGSCHIWINGEETEQEDDAVKYVLWDGQMFPPEPDKDKVYVLINGITGEGENPRVWKSGSMVQFKNNEWTEYTGDVTLTD
ncbi:MAG: hypothetical protein K2H61_09480, partial [Muribaculaceae bacterium]|nr:hypothetical protein [Muribaculaceae bacterium]